MKTTIDTRRIVLLVGMPLAGKSFIAQELQKALPTVEIANTSDALVTILAAEKKVTVKQILRHKERHRPDLITLGDNLSKGGNLVMHYICNGKQIITGVRRKTELEAVREIKNLNICTVYVAGDQLALPDNLDITPAECDFVLFNPRVKTPNFSANPEFQRIIRFLTQ